MAELVLLPCPFCGGAGIPAHALRDGYAETPDDQDATAYWITCRSCAATGGWAKTASGGSRRWNTRATPSPARAAGTTQYYESCGHPAGNARGFYLFRHPTGRYLVSCPDCCQRLRVEGCVCLSGTIAV